MVFETQHSLPPPPPSLPPFPSLPLPSPSFLLLSPIHFVGHNSFPKAVDGGDVCVKNKPLVPYMEEITGNRFVVKFVCVYVYVWCMF